jgi:hypothetical protein
MGNRNSMAQNSLEERLMQAPFLMEVLEPLSVLVDTPFGILPLPHSFAVARTVLL